jgi:hypothetical protein
MAAKRQTRSFSSPMELTQEQVDMARKGYSERVFAAIDKAGRAGKSRPKAKSAKRRSSKRAG